MTDLAINVLCFGDNLDILRRYLPDAAIALDVTESAFHAGSVCALDERAPDGAPSHV